MEHVSSKVGVITSIDTTYNGSIKLTRIQNGNVLTEIGTNACYEGKLTGIDMSETEIIKISGSAFFNCYYLSHVVLPETVQTLGIHAFLRCCFSSIFIPASLVSFNGWSFNKITGLNCITVSQNHPLYISKENYVLTKDMTTIIMGPKNFSCSDLNSFQGITKINELALAGSTIKRISGLGSLQQIINYALSWCDSLIEVDLRETQLTQISQGCFQRCTHLEIVYFPENLKTISKEAFMETSLRLLSLPPSITELYSTAFDLNSVLKTVLYYGTTNFADSNIWNISSPRIHVTKAYPSNTFGKIAVIHDAFDYWMKLEFKKTCHRHKHLNNRLSFIFVFIVL